MARHRSNRRVILPVWHRISQDDLVQSAPILADLLAASTDRGLQHVVEQIVRASFPERSSELRPNLLKPPTGKTTANVQAYLAELVNGGAKVADVRLLITSHQWLLAGLYGRRANTVAAFRVGADELCDFLVVEEQGITGPMTLHLIRFGPTELDGDDLLRFLHAEAFHIGGLFGLARSILHSSRRNDRDAPFVGQYPKILEVALKLSEQIEQLMSGTRREHDRENYRNMHWSRPDTWSLRTTLVLGKRNRAIVEKRDAIADKAGIGLQVASYNRLLDSPDSWYFGDDDL
jgi:hypothetical protein